MLSVILCVKRATTLLVDDSVKVMEVIKYDLKTIAGWCRQWACGRPTMKRPWERTNAGVNRYSFLCRRYRKFFFFFGLMNTS